MMLRWSLLAAVCVLALAGGETPPVPGGLVLLRTLAEAAEAGARRKTEPSFVAGDALAEAQDCFRRLRVARAAWHGGATAWGAEGSRRVPLALAAAEDVAQSAAAAMLIDALAEVARGLVDPTRTDHPLCLAVRAATATPDGTDLPQRDDGVHILPWGVAEGASFQRLTSWRRCGAYDDGGAAETEGVEFPACLDAGALALQVGTIRLPGWVTVIADAEGRLACPGTGRVHAECAVESSWDEERWLRLRSTGPLRLWMDDRPVWAQAAGPVAVELRLHFGRGRHRLRLDLTGGDAVQAAISASLAESERTTAMEDAAVAALLAKVPEPWSMDAPTFPPPAGCADLALPRWRQHWACQPPFWAVAAPAPGGDPAAWRPSLGSATEARPVWRFFDAALVQHRRGHQIGGMFCRAVFSETSHLPCTALGAAGAPGPLLLATLVDNDRRRLVQPIIRGPGVKAWLDGRPLASDQSLRFDAGLHLLCVQVAPGTMPAALRERAQVQVGLAQLQVPLHHLHQAWLDAVRPLTGGLLTVLRTRPGTPEAERARAALELLAESDLDDHH